MKGDVQPVEVVLQTVLHFSLEAVGGSSVRERKKRFLSSSDNDSKTASEDECPQ